MFFLISLTSTIYLVLDSLVPFTVYSNSLAHLHSALMLWQLSMKEFSQMSFSYDDKKLTLDQFDVLNAAAVLHFLELFVDISVL